jgi:hypothetical protein
MHELTSPTPDAVEYVPFGHRTQTDASTIPNPVWNDPATHNVQISWLIIPVPVP